MKLPDTATGGDPSGARRRATIHASGVGGPVEKAMSGERNTTAEGSGRDAAKRDEGFLELEVADFGPIVRAQVELRPLTVFVGPSNTGKSVLAILCYALHRFFSDHGRVRYGSWADRRITGDTPGTATVRGSDVEESRRWLEQVLADGLSEKTTTGLVPLPQPAARLVRSALSGASERGQRLDDEIARCFGVERSGRLARHGTRRGAVTLRYRPAAGMHDASIEHRFEVQGNGTSPLSSSLPAEIPLVLDPDRVLPVEISRRVDSAGWDDEHLLDALIRATAPGLVGAAGRRACYLPAARSGLMDAHRAIVASLVRRASRSAAASDPTLSAPTADFLEMLIQLGDQASGDPWGPDLAASLESSVLGGVVGFRRSANGYPAFWWRPTGWQDDLPLARASSMVSELAPVVLWLRHVAQRDDVLIIEEPEAHLHPARQVGFVRGLARLVQGGMRVIVTTHSEWVLEALANLVSLSEAPAAARAELADADLALSADQVGAWLFQPHRRARGSEVREIPLDRESGAFPSGFDRVADELHNQWAEIRNRSGDL